ncbi:MAG: glycosyltransferase, partial [Chloroflexi bacterium]
MAEVKVEAPDLAVVIVSWNVRERLRACLQALQAELARWGRQGTVWVVDNGSTDGSPAMVRHAFPQV